MPHELMAQAYDRRQSFIVALDNDIAGEQGWRKAWDTTADWTGFQVSSDCPEHKDWNDDLVQRAASSSDKLPPSSYERSPRDHPRAVFFHVR